MLGFERGRPKLNNSDTVGAEFVVESQKTVEDEILILAGAGASIPRRQHIPSGKPIRYHTRDAHADRLY